MSIEDKVEMIKGLLNIPKAEIFKSQEEAKASEEVG